MKSNLNGEKLLKIAKAYESPTWWYDLRGFFILTFSYNDFLWNQMLFFRKNLQGHHLEAAIGTGTLAKLTDLWNHYILGNPLMTGIGFDYSSDMLEGAKNKFASPNFTLQIADASHLPFLNNSFDSINLANALHCIPEVDLALKEMYRVLKPECYFFTNVLIYPDKSSFFGKIADGICTWGIRKGILVTPYNIEDITEIMKKVGFVVIERFSVGNNLYLIAKKI